MSLLGHDLTNGIAGRGLVASRTKSALRVWKARALRAPRYIPQLARLAGPGAVFDSAGTVAPLVPVALHVGAILLANAAYRAVAEALTDFERHPTQQAHDQALIVKRFIFEALDCYMAPASRARFLLFLTVRPLPSLCFFCRRLLDSGSLG